MKRYQQVAASITREIESGRYRSGERIPGTRDLVSQFKVSVSTVMAAQRLLEQQGVVEARPRSGYYVRTRVTGLERPTLKTTLGAPALVGDQQQVMRLLQTQQDPSILALGAAVPDTALLPHKALARACRQALRGAGSGISDYSFPPGLPELREQLVPLLRPAGINTTADELVITDGCHEALRLALRCVTSPGDVIAIESPTYYGILQLIHALGLKALEIPADSQTGMSLDALRLAMDQWPVKAVLVMANFSNPGGATLTDGDKAELVRLCTERDIPLIENDVYGELGFQPLRPLALRHFDSQGQVLYCSSASKTVAPGLRVGWMLPGRWIEQAAYLKFTSSLATATLSQMTLCHYLAESNHNRHLRQMTLVLSETVNRARQLIQQAWPEGVRVSRPAGGLVLWVELPAPWDSQSLARQALVQGVSIAPGNLFTTGDKFRRCLRLNCALPWSQELERGLLMLGTLLHQQAVD